MKTKKGSDDRLNLLEAFKEQIADSKVTSTTTTSTTSTTTSTTTTRPIPIGPSAEKGVQLPEHDEYDGDEPLVIKKPEKDAITFHPEIVKQTLAKLDNLSKDELELINKFVDAYKNKVNHARISLVNFTDRRPHDHLIYDRTNSKILDIRMIRIQRFTLS